MIEEQHVAPIAIRQQPQNSSSPDSRCCDYGQHYHYNCVQSFQIGFDCTPHGIHTNFIGRKHFSIAIQRYIDAEPIKLSLSDGIIILGPHRSGTSLTGNLLKELGVYIKSDFPATEFNERGYWEDIEVVKLNESILYSLGGDWISPPTIPRSWNANSSLESLRRKAYSIRAKYDNWRIWAWKDPRLCLTLPLWKPVIPHSTYLLCVRNPFAVAKSLVRRDGLDLDVALYVWYWYMLEALKNIKGEKSMFVFYEDYFDYPDQTISRIAEFLSLKVQESVTSVISSELKHHDPTLDDTLTSSSIPAAVKTLYQILSTSKVLGVAPNLQEWLITPGTENLAFPESTQLKVLKHRLEVQSESLRQLRAHPYVKLGLKVKGFLSAMGLIS
jgi:Sulfotransferase family